MKHTPTKSMQSAAKRGIELLKNPQISNNDIPDVSLKGGKKIASGQQITDDHVRSMAAYHAGHMGDCPAGGDAENVDDLLWGGPSGASWSASRCAAMDATSLSQVDVDLDKLVSDDSPFSIELYTRPDLLHEGKLDLKKGEDGLIWAPILRSGTLAVRPDPTAPNGRKQEPLVFVSGHAASSTEIGLVDLVEAFNDTAVQHVTIPKTHRNDEFENTGFIRKLKIADSTMRPGEQVILAGHEFLDSDAEQRVEAGLIANRSCGILHAYQNTETGKTYPHVIEHVALTNKPWVTGMEPYGSDLFSDGRQVVPLMLSDNVIVPPPAPTKPAILFSTRTPLEALEHELNLADVLWNDQDGEPSLMAIQSQLYSSLREMGRSPFFDEDSVWFSVRDVRPSSALVEVDYGGSDAEDAWVIPFSWQDGKLVLSDFSQWQVAHQAWVADDDANQDKAEVQQALEQEANVNLSERQLHLGTLTSKARKALSDSDFVFPNTREYPIQDLAHGRNALGRAAQNETGARLAAVKSAVYKRYPQLRPGSDSSKTNTSLPDDPIKRASMLRLSQEPSTPATTGGNMSLTPELLASLNLSDEAREVLQRQMAEEQRTTAELARYRQTEKESGRVTRLARVKEIFGEAATGTLAEFDALLMADDNDVAVSLNLADATGTPVKTNLTITQVIDRILASFPKGTDAGKLALANKTNLLENPLSGRPDLKPDPAEIEGAVTEQTGDQLLAAWQKALPGGLDLAIASTPAPAA